MCLTKESLATTSDSDLLTTFKTIIKLTAKHGYAKGYDPGDQMIAETEILERLARRHPGVQTVLVESNNSD